MSCSVSDGSLISALRFRVSHMVQRASVTMAEDDIYRTSTQYRLWSFTAESLASLRSTTNSLAADRVRAAIKRLRQSQSSGADAAPADDIVGESGIARQVQEHNEVDCLSVEEEKKLVGYYCSRAMELADFCDFPTNVKVSPRAQCHTRFLHKLTLGCRLQPYNTSSASTYPTLP